MKRRKILTAGLFQNNAAFMLFLGLCPTLATTTSLVSAFGMGIAVLFTIIITNVAISLLRKIVPNEIRIPVLIVVIASTVTIVELLMKAFMFDLSQTLGVYLSLIVVNCIILGRAEAFAMKNGPLDSALDAIGTGIGFLGGLLLLAFFRELLGTGGFTFSRLTTGEHLFTLQIIPKDYAFSIFADAPGAFIIFGLLAAGINYIVKITQANKIKKAAALKATGGK